MDSEGEYKILSIYEEILNEMCEKIDYGQNPNDIERWKLGRFGYYVTCLKANMNR